MTPELRRRGSQCLAHVSDTDLNLCFEVQKVPLNTLF